MQYWLTIKKKKKNVGGLNLLHLFNKGTRTLNYVAAFS